MKVLVTGGAGYIGSHTVVELITSGYETVIIDNFSNSYPQVRDAIEKISGKSVQLSVLDLCDKEPTDDFFKKNNIDAIIHFAAFKAVGESVENPLKYYRNNLQSLVNLLDAAIKNKVKYFVFSSSCSVYGNPEKFPVDENAAINPQSPYARTKQVGENIVRDSVMISSIKAISLRYFNPIGAHDSALIGELPLGPPNNLVPVITQTAIGKRNELLVFGDDYNTPDGSCIRDYIHVVDIAKAHVNALQMMINITPISSQEEIDSKDSNYQVFNLGTGEGNSVLEVINLFEKTTGQKVSYRIVGRRSGDVEKVYADSSLANAKLGWKAERNLENMLQTAWNWELKLADIKITNKENIKL